MDTRGMCVPHSNRYTFVLTVIRLTPLSVLTLTNGLSVQRIGSTLPDLADRYMASSTQTTRSPTRASTPIKASWPLHACTKAWRDSGPSPSDS